MFNNGKRTSLLHILVLKQNTLKHVNNYWIELAKLYLVVKRNFLFQYCSWVSKLLKIRHLWQLRIVIFTHSCIHFTELKSFIVVVTGVIVSFLSKWVSSCLFNSAMFVIVMRSHFKIILAFLPFSLSFSLSLSCLLS